MAQQLIAALEAEIESLESELLRDIRYARLQSLRHTLSLYVDPEPAFRQLRPAEQPVMQTGQVFRGTGGHSRLRSDTGASAAPQRSAGRRISVEKSQALDAAAMLLRNRSGPVPTREILEHLADCGIDVGGSVPINNLSATLSNSDRFISAGRTGWLLNEYDQSSVEASQETEEDVYRTVSSEYIDENAMSSIKEIATHIDFGGDIPDDVKDDLMYRFKRKTGQDYEANSGKFHKAFTKEIERVMENITD